MQKCVLMFFPVAGTVYGLCADGQRMLRRLRVGGLG